MGGCYSSSKSKRKEDGKAPTPEATELVTEEATLEVPKACKEETTSVGRSLPKELAASEVVTTTSEVLVPLKEEATTSEVVVMPLKNVATEVALTPKEEESASEVVIFCANEETTVQEAKLPMKETNSKVTTEVNATTDEVTMEASKLNDKSDVKETKKDEDNKDGEKVVDDSKPTEKKTPDEESGPKVYEAEVVASKEDQKESKCIETKENVKVIEGQETEK
ncbi:hypothetical protein Hdeb2414_s0014g00424881 [Helianthus debilis subsp. tardiflorus]